MAAETALPVIAHAIQLSIAPVFLLTGIAGLLGVMANRLARIIDRARQLELTWHDMYDSLRASAREEIGDLERRRHLASWSINFCTSAALLVCLVIVLVPVVLLMRGRRRRRAALPVGYGPPGAYTPQQWGPPPPGPPPRGLFEHRYKVEDGRLHILAGRLPTLSESA